MAFDNLTAFIQELERSGELIRISEFVSPGLEITEITDRVSKHRGKALLFENTGTEFPVLINAFGSERRICTALGVKQLDEIGERIKMFFDEMTVFRNGLFEKLAVLPALGEISSWLPHKRRGKGACQEVISENPDLSRLPVLTCWPYDGGPFLTLPAVHTVHPESGIRNVGMYRMQVTGKAETGMHWHLHKGSAAHYREYKRLGRKMPVTVTLGGDPVYIYSATAPLPENIDEYLLAGFIRRKKVEMVKCLTNELYVPADVDFVIEGYIDPEEELMLEGPFGDHTGFYSLADYYPRFHVTCISHRKGAVYPATVVGIPPQEDAWIGKATERIFLAPLRIAMAPEIIDMVMPPEGIMHNLVIVKIKNEFPGQPVKVMNALWGVGQMMFNKVMIVVDENANLSDYNALAEAIIQNTDPALDVIFNRGPLDVLDHAGSSFAYGGKMGIDATGKMRDRANHGQQEMSMPGYTALLSHPEVEFVGGVFVSEPLPAVVLAVKKDRPGYVRDLHSRLFHEGALNGFRFVAYIDRFAASLSPRDILWIVCNNIDPVRDCFYPTGGKNEFMLPLAVDGTVKSAKFDGIRRPWPNVVIMDDATIGKIDAIWQNLGIGPFLPSPSLKYKALVKNDGAVAEG